jgi:hypothetical protein
MNDSELMHPLQAVSAAMVPAGYAEKAMASLMQLHCELMEEKERRVDLYRRLMEREQAVAELRMYVKLLEEKLGQGSAPVKAPARVETTVQSAAPGKPPMRAETTVHSAAPAADRAAAIRPAPPPPPPPRAARPSAPPPIKVVRAPVREVAPPEPIPLKQPAAKATGTGSKRPVATEGWKTW